jgi:two-component system sensor histidine kinase/response regulator
VGRPRTDRLGRGTLPDADAVTAIVEGTDPGDQRDLLLADTQRYARLMEVFVGVLSHDLRNPLTAIITASHMLEQDQDGRAAVRIRQSAERMGRMIDQLLDFSRIKMGAGLPLDAREIDLAPVGRMVLGELEAAYPHHRIRLEERGSLWGTWDRDRLAQLLSNLGGNACQHGDDPIQIALDGSDAQLVRIAVDNRGSIPDELIADLFEPGARRGRSGGLGLGLYIAQQIASAHGGSIQVTSSDTSTRFLVEMPRRAVLNEDTGTFKLERMSEG